MMEKELHSLKEALEEEIRKITKKGDMTPAELENATKAVCLLEKIRDLEERNMGDGYAEGWNPHGYMRTSYDDMSEGGSYARGRSPVTGRYISRGMNGPYDPLPRGYSGHSIKDRMVAKLEEMYDEAKTDHERETVNSWIKRLETER